MQGGFDWLDGVDAVSTNMTTFSLHKRTAFLLEWARCRVNVAQEPPILANFFKDEIVMIFAFRIMLSLSDLYSYRYSEQHGLATLFKSEKH